MEVIAEKKLVPQLRFHGLIENWKSISYGDIYSFYTTNSFSRDKLNYGKGYVKNIHYGDIHTKFSTIFDIQNEKVPYINEDINLSKIKKESYCKEGDLVIADASEDYLDIGKSIELINLNNEKIIAGLHTFLARPKDNILAKGFAGYLMQSWKIRKQVMIIAQGIKVLSLSTRRLAKLELIIPTLPEQQKIALFLSAVDKKIEQLSQKKTLFETYKKGVMQKIFSQELRFKQEDGSNYPDWEEKKLGDVSIKKSSNISANNLENNIGKFNIYGASGLIKSIDFYRENQDYISIVKDGAGVGRTLLCEAYSSVLGTLDIVIPKPNNNLYFIYSILNRINFVKYITGSTIPHIYFKDYSKEKIEAPCLLEQKKIASFLSAIDKKIEFINTQLEQTKIFKKGLLQQMFV